MMACPGPLQGGPGSIQTNLKTNRQAGCKNAGLPIPMEKTMKVLTFVTLLLVIVGGLNWGLVGLLNWDMVAGIFGAGSLLARAVYILVGLSAIWQLVPHIAVLGSQTSGLPGHST